MESSGGNMDGMKPLMAKAGIPLAISIATGYVCSRFFISRTRTPLYEAHHDDSNNNTTTQEITPVQSKSPCTQQQQPFSSTTTYQLHQDIEDKLLHLKTHLESLQKRELELETKFYQYQELKERESNIIELKNTKMLEQTRAEFMEKEISLMEAENKRLGELLIEYLRVLGLVEDSKVENRLLKRKGRKLWRKNVEKSRIIKGMEEKLKMIEGREEEELKVYRREVEERDEFIEGLENQISVLKCDMDRLCREKIELSEKLELAQKSLSPKVEDGSSLKAKKDYTNVSKELEQIQKDRAEEMKELIQLRWTNACLRYELMRCQGGQEIEVHQQEQGQNNHLDEKYDDDHDDGIDNFQGHAHDWDNVNGQNCSKRKKFIKKLRKLVEGGGGKIEEKDKHNCFRRQSNSGELEQEVVHARKSCSSACSSANSVSYDLSLR